MDNFPAWLDHILALFFCVAIPLFGARQRKGFSGVPFSSEQKKQIYIAGSFSLFLMGAAVGIVWLLFRRPISELGLTQPSNFSAWWWMPLVFALIYIADAFITLSSKKGMDEAIESFKKRTPFLPTKTKELPEYFLMCFSAGVFEEIAYRGFLVTYCWYLFEGSNYQTMFAVAVPAFAFAIAHFYQGAKAVVKIFVLAIFFGYMFILSGSLLLVMILHILVDALGGLLTIKYMKDDNEPEQLGDENNFY
jgi:membrane protease YdiL (CAAX protease family)